MKKNKKRLSLFVLFAFISGILYVPFIFASEKNVTYLIWFIFPLASSVAVFLFSLIGFKFIDKTNFQMPILMKFEKNEKIESLDFYNLYKSIFFGVLLGLIIFFFNKLFEIPKNPGNILERLLTTPWAGFVTEVISHLVVMTGIMIILNNKWISILLSSFIFLILFHLNGFESSIMVNVYISSANFAGATLTGWIYSKYGFESAVVAHSSMHIILLCFN